MDEVDKMRRRWVGKDFSIGRLQDLVEDFFQSRGFNTRMEESSRRCMFSALPPKGSVIRETINIEISIGPDSLEIDFIAGRKTNSSIKLGMLTTLLGGGGILLRGLRSQEAVDRLENDFWRYLNEKIYPSSHLEDQ